MLVPRRAAEQFSVRAAGDIVVGDTILFTERLLVDRGGNGALLGEPARGSARPLASNANRGNCRSRNATGPQHVGDRTVAAHVVAEAHYTKKGVRELRLEIVWCTVSSHDAAPYVLRPGDVTQRDAAHVIQFQTFRQPWVDEHKRLP
jgi:hypothetical protein